MRHVCWPVLSLFAACEPASDRVATGSAAPSVVVPGEPEEVQAVPVGSQEARDLAASLWAIDSALPSRAEVERGYEDGVGALVEIARGGWAQPIERGNALRMLGDWGDVPRVGELLVVVATDGREAERFRAAALTGLQRIPAAVAAHGPSLLPLLRDPHSGVASAAALVLAKDPASRHAVERIAADSTVHRDVRRIAALALRRAGSPRDLAP